MMSAYAIAMGAATIENIVDVMHTVIPTASTPKVTEDPLGRGRCPPTHGGSSRESSEEEEPEERLKENFRH